MGDTTDVEVTTDAIQNHEVEEVTTSENGGEVNQEPETTDVNDPPAYISDRDRRADAILNRQREERNDEIARELGYDRVPGEDKKNITDEEEIENNITEPDETIINEENKELEDNISNETKTNDDELDQSSQLVDQTEEDDLKLNKPGFYGDKVVLKIDGQLVQMPADKALSVLQKNQSADKRLENVVLRERQLTLREQQLQQQNRPQPSAPRVPDVVDTADIEKRARTIVQSVEDGEQEKAVESLVALVSDTVGRQPKAQPTLTPDQIAELVTRQTHAQEATTVESRLKTSGNYDDIFNDDIAYNLAIQNVQTLNTVGFEGSTEQLMIEAMERVRDWKSGQSREIRLSAKTESEPKPKPKSPEISEPQRLEKKRDSARPVKSSTTIQRPASIQPEAEPSELDKRRSIFDKLKAARGQ